MCVFQPRRLDATQHGDAREFAPVQLAQHACHDGSWRQHRRQHSEPSAGQRQRHLRRPGLRAADGDGARITRLRRLHRGATARDRRGDSWLRQPYCADQDMRTSLLSTKRRRISCFTRSFLQCHAQ